MPHQRLSGELKLLILPDYNEATQLFCQGGVKKRSSGHGLCKCYNRCKTQKNETESKTLIMTVHRVEMIQNVFFSMKALRPIFHLPALPFWEKLIPTQIPWLQYYPIQMANKTTLILRFPRNESS